MSFNESGCVFTSASSIQPYAAIMASVAVGLISFTSISCGLAGPELWRGRGPLSL